MSGIFIIFHLIFETVSPESRTHSWLDLENSSDLPVSTFLVQVLQAHVKATVNSFLYELWGFELRS